MTSVERFICFPDPQNSKSIFLTDYVFWADNEQELDEWCSKNDCIRTGMIVTPLSENAFTWFVLRWS
jgi:hypothetical protein